MHEAFVSVVFRRRAQTVGGAMYLPGEVAAFPPDVAAQLCAENDNPTATLFKSLDAPPINKMVGRADHKKERPWVSPSKPV